MAGETVMEKDGPPEELQEARFHTGDIVKLKGTYRSHTSALIAPEYLYGDEMVVEKVCRKNIKVSNWKYPGDFWYIRPQFLVKQRNI